MSGKSRDLCGAFLMVMMTLNSGPYIWLMWLSIHEPYKSVLRVSQLEAVCGQVDRLSVIRQLKPETADTLLGSKPMGATLRREVTRFM